MVGDECVLVLGWRGPGKEGSCLLQEQVICQAHACSSWQPVVLLGLFGPERCCVTQLLWLEEDSFLNNKDKSVMRSISEQESQNMFCSQVGSPDLFIV